MEDRRGRRNPASAKPPETPSLAQPHKNNRRHFFSKPLSAASGRFTPATHAAAGASASPLPGFARQAFISNGPARANYLPSRRNGVLHQSHLPLMLLGIGVLCVLFTPAPPCAGRRKRVFVEDAGPAVRRRRPGHTRTDRGQRLPADETAIDDEVDAGDEGGCARGEEHRRADHLVRAGDTLHGVSWRNTSR